jgi:hypothetical protein
MFYTFHAIDPVMAGTKARSLSNTFAADRPRHPSTHTQAIDRHAPERSPKSMTEN